MTTPRVSVCVLAFEAAPELPECLASVQWADELLVVDSHSTDDTAKIAEAMGARVVQVEFRGFGALRNTALEHCSGEWIFSLDSDERCTPEVRDEILAIVTAQPPPHAAYRVARRNLFLGREIRHSGWSPDYRQPQLFRRGALRYGSEPVHERYELLGGASLGTLRHAIWQVPYRDLERLQRKIERYSTLGAQRLVRSGRRVSPLSAVAHATWAFARQYVLQRGFLDGWPGLLLAVSHCEATFYKYAKARSLRARPAGPRPGD